MAMAASLTSLQRWLNYVDDQLSPEAVDYLKLGLHSEFFCYHSDVQGIDKPSLLYYFLLNRCMRQSESQALKMFLHVVRGLGGNLRGNVVICEGFGRGSTFDVKDPGLFDLEKASVNFKFFQCLLKISTKAHQMALGDQLKKKFSKKRFLNTNYRHIKNLPELFIRLYQKKFIAGNNTHHLIEALSKYKAWVCLQILNSYHKSVGLQLIPLALKMEKKFGPISFSSSDPSSCEDSASESAASEMVFRKSYYDGTELDSIDEEDSIRFSYVSTVHSTQKTVAAYDQNEESDPDTCIIDSAETERMIKRHQDAATDQLGVNGLVVMSKPRRNSKLGRNILITITAVLVLCIVVAVVTLLFKMWLPLRPLPVSSQHILRGSTIIVDEVKSMFHETVNVRATVNNDSSSEQFLINFYGTAQSCDNIYGMNFPPKTRNVCFSEKNSTKDPPQYALKSSTYHYDIYSNSTSEVQYVLVCAYQGFDYDHGSRKKCKKMYLGEDCGTFEAPEAGYYFFKVVSESTMKDITNPYMLCIEEKLHILHPNTDEMLTSCSISHENMQCQFSLPLGSEYCLMADFFPNPLFVHNVTLNVEVTDSRIVILLVTPLSILLFFVILFCLLVCVPFCCCKYCKSKRSVVTIV